jgi:transglutaminase-like putative cysteine protease
VIYRVSHLTEYVYSASVSSSHHQLHLLSRRLPNQYTRWEDLSVNPMPGRRFDHIDAFGNRETHLEIHEPHRRLAVLSRSEIEIESVSSPFPALAPAWEVVRDTIRQRTSAPWLDVCEFTFASHYVPISARVADFALPSFPRGRPIIEAAIDLMHRIHGEFTYDSHATNISTPVEEVLSLKRGVCQDFAHLSLASFRALGLAARYVSGYLVTAVPGQPRLVGADASHAWVQVYCPDVGWVDFDPTNDVIPTDKHLTLAFGRDFGDVTPLRGVILGGGRHQLRVVVDVAPINDDDPIGEDSALGETAQSA